MGRKRARGEGTAYPYRDGWAAQVTLGWDPVRKKQRRKTFYGDTQRRVLDQVRAWREGGGEVATQGTADGLNRPASTGRPLAVLRIAPGLRAARGGHLTVRGARRVMPC